MAWPEIIAITDNFDFYYTDSRQNQAHLDVLELIH